MAPVALSAVRPAWMARVEKPVAYETMEGSPVCESFRFEKPENENATSPLARAVAPFANRKRESISTLQLLPSPERQHPGRASASAWTFAAAGSGVPWRGRIAAFYKKARARRPRAGLPGEKRLRKEVGALSARAAWRRFVLGVVATLGIATLGIAALGIAAMRMVRRSTLALPPWPWGRLSGAALGCGGRCGCGGRAS